MRDRGVLHSLTPIIKTASRGSKGMPYARYRNLEPAFLISEEVKVIQLEIATSQLILSHLLSRVGTEAVEYVRLEAHLIIILHDCPLSRTRIHPSHKILHVSRHEHRRVRYRARTDTDVSLLDCCHGLVTRQLNQAITRIGDTSETVSAIFSRVATTASRRRAIDETVTLFSMSDGLTPMSSTRCGSAGC